MKIYKSAEDYLERILMFEEEKTPMRAIDLANSMNLTKQSIHRALKNFKEDELIHIDENNFITLTPKGREIAVRVYERHVILTNFFIYLGVDKEIAHEDACKVEHDISDESLYAIKKFIEK